METKARPLGGAQGERPHVFPTPRAQGVAEEREGVAEAVGRPERRGEKNDGTFSAALAATVAGFGALQARTELALHAATPRASRAESEEGAGRERSGRGGASRAPSFT